LREERKRETEETDSPVAVQGKAGQARKEQQERNQKGKIRKRRSNT